MSGKAIGISLNLGYQGNITRMGDGEVFPRLVKSIITNGAETLSKLAFGDAAVLNTDNTYSRFGDTGTGVSAATAANFAGIAVREVKQTTDYFSAAGEYKPGEMADVLKKGHCAIKVAQGTPTAGGKVYIRTVAATGKLIGDFECEAVTDETVELTNVKFTTGIKDANGLAEVTITGKVTP